MTPPAAKPGEILARARALVDANEPAAAREMLAQAWEQHSQSWTRVPPGYHILLGRLALHASDFDSAAIQLGRARDARPDGFPAALRRQLGTALLQAGRTEAAGQELDQALRDGIEIEGFRARMAVNEHRMACGEPELLETKCPRYNTITDPDRRVFYAAIPKNACSLLKVAMILNSRHRDAYLASGQTIHDFCGALARSQPPSLGRPDPEFFRFVVLRHPLRRALSAYIDKFVFARFNNPHLASQVARTVREAQACLGIPNNPSRGISFEEFVRYLAVARDVQLDPHWMPQVRLVGDDLNEFDHVGTVERLPQTLALLAERFGYVAPESLAGHIPNGDRHVTPFSQSVRLDAPYRALPAEFAALQDGLPDAEHFLPPDLASLLSKRYEADANLHEAATRRLGG